MDFAAIRQRLDLARDDRFWRSLEEGLSRRRFLTCMGASLALAGLGGCQVQPPEEPIMPYVREPEQLIPGRSLFYATAMTTAGLATGLLVESHEGRPTKIEGNPIHPASLGATDAAAQASVLGLYDPDRSQNLLGAGRVRTWDEAALDIRKEMARQRERKGAGLRILTQTISSPTLVEQIEGLLAAYPAAKWIQYDPVNQDAARAGSRLAFGEYVETCYHFDRAGVVLALDADFSTCGPGHLRWAHDFAMRRRAGVGPKGTVPFSSNENRDSPPANENRDSPPQMGRVWAVEPMPSGLGAKADHRWPLGAAEVETFARMVAARLDKRLKPPEPGATRMPPWLDALVGDLEAHRGASIVIAGQQQSPSVHALAHAMNHALGNVGKAVSYTEPVEARPGDQTRALRELAEEMDAGQVEMLVILGGNPAYDTPADLRFADRMAAKHGAAGRGADKVPLRIHLGLYVDETAVRCHWHIPETHYLEQWSDARAFDGTASIVQPLIAPLYDGRSAHEVVAVLGELTGPTAYDLVRRHWQAFWKKQDRDERFEEFWEKVVHDGVIPDTKLPVKSVSLREDWATRLESARRTDWQSVPQNLELIFRPDPNVHDGRFANNGWLQELPRPMTKIVWDNAALMSPATARRYKLSSKPSGHGGEHGEATTDVVRLTYREATLDVPVWIVPGHADDCVTLHLGLGRTHAGKVGSGVGVNAYLLRNSETPWFDRGLGMEKTGETRLLASTQQHFSTADRAPVQVTTAGQQREERLSAESAARAPGQDNPTLYPGYAYEGYKWALAIDLNACVGCNACVVACQAENNIPVVGKEQVMAAREMHWLRIDRYFHGPEENPEIYFQPVPCMHCENAPCELVCPVGATVHSEDGLNDMVYNRCVGTRYCSNNCPYKVRRFNFLAFSDFQTPTIKLLHNPDVTVRSRGVMEKCTYCVQRIRRAEIQAEREDRKIRDGEVLTACQAACPTRAITLGNLNDAKSEVIERRREPRHYGLLAELSTRPRTTYLAVVRNPHPDAAKPAEDA